MRQDQFIARTMIAGTVQQLHLDSSSLYKSIEGVLIPRRPFTTASIAVAAVALQHPVQAQQSATCRPGRPSMIQPGHRPLGSAGNTSRHPKPPSRLVRPGWPSASTRTCNAAAAARQEMCVIVDENNQVVGSATRKETVSRRLLGRGSYVLVFNAAQQLFVSKRSHSKDCYPGCLDVTISGVVNVVRESGSSRGKLTCNSLSCVLLFCLSLGLAMPRQSPTAELHLLPSSDTLLLPLHRVRSMKTQQCGSCRRRSAFQLSNPGSCCSTCGFSPTRTVSATCLAVLSSCSGTGQSPLLMQRSSGGDSCLCLTCSSSCHKTRRGSRPWGGTYCSYILTGSSSSSSRA